MSNIFLVKKTNINSMIKNVEDFLLKANQFSTIIISLPRSVFEIVKNKQNRFYINKGSRDKWDVIKTFNKSFTKSLNSHITASSIVKWGEKEYLGTKGVKI